MDTFIIDDAWCLWLLVKRAMIVQISIYQIGFVLPLAAGQSRWSGWYDTALELQRSWV